MRVRRRLQTHIGRKGVGRLARLVTETGWIRKIASRESSLLPAVPDTVTGCICKFTSSICSLLLPEHPQLPVDGQLMLGWEASKWPLDACRTWLGLTFDPEMASMLSDP